MTTEQTVNQYELPIARESLMAATFDSPAHNGVYEGAIELVAELETAVLAPLDGTVVAVIDSHQEYGPSNEHAHQANFIQIQHDGGEISDLIHLEAGSALVREGRQVRQGQVLAWTGLSGWMTDPHLHWNVFRSNGSEAGFETLKIQLGSAAAELIAKKELVVIPTDREGLLLRQLVLPSDDRDYSAAVREYRGHPNSFGKAIAAKYPTLGAVTQARLNAGNVLRLGIRDADYLLQGMIKATPSQDGNEVEIGYWIRPSAVHQGTATLAVKALTEYLRPRFDRVFAEVEVGNNSSMKVLCRNDYAVSGEEDRDWGRAIIFDLLGYQGWSLKTPSKD